jgi:hypothetical protein
VRALRNHANEFLNDYFYRSGNGSGANGPTTFPPRERTHAAFLSEPADKPAQRRRADAERRLGFGHHSPADRATARLAKRRAIASDR